MWVSSKLFISLKNVEAHLHRLWMLTQRQMQAEVDGNELHLLLNIYLSNLKKQKTFFVYLLTFFIKNKSDVIISYWVPQWFFSPNTPLLLLKQLFGWLLFISTWVMFFKGTLLLKYILGNSTHVWMQEYYWFHLQAVRIRPVVLWDAVRLIICWASELSCAYCWHLVWWGWFNYTVCVCVRLNAQ